MGKFLTFLLFGMLAVLTTISQASASPIQGHEEFSPFEKEKHGKVYCVLKKHHLGQIYCPHKSRQLKEKDLIRSGCNGSNSQTGILISNNLFNFLVKNVKFDISLHLVNQKLFIPARNHYFYPLVAIDHPPKTV